MTGKIKKKKLEKGQTESLTMRVKTLSKLKCSVGLKMKKKFLKKSLVHHRFVCKLNQSLQRHNS